MAHIAFDSLDPDVRALLLIQVKEAEALYDEAMDDVYSSTTDEYLAYAGGTADTLTAIFPPPPLTDTKSVLAFYRDQLDATMEFEG